MPSLSLTWKTLSAFWRSAASSSERPAHWAETKSKVPLLVLARSTAPASAPTSAITRSSTWASRTWFLAVERAKRVISTIAADWRSSALIESRKTSRAPLGTGAAWGQRATRAEGFGAAMGLGVGDDQRVELAVGRRVGGE